MHAVRYSASWILVAALGASSSGCGNPTAASIQPIYQALSPTVSSGLLQAVVEARNPESRPITFEIRDPCGVTLRLYPESGSVPVWDQLDWLNSRPGGCKSIPMSLTLGPGESRTMTATASVGDILGDSLPSGTYRARIVVWQGVPAPGLVEVPAPGTVVLAR